MTEAPQSNQPGPTTTTLDDGSGGLYRFLGCTAGQYMTRAVISVTREVTMRELEALFERYDFNSFPVVEGGRVIGIVTKFDFLKAFTFTTGQMVLRRVDATVGCRSDDASRRARGTDNAIDPSPGIDGQPDDPQPAGVEPRARTGRHHLSRRCDARAA
jgi:CBS domain-containing protein